MAITYASDPKNYTPYEYEAELPFADLFKGFAHKQSQFDQNAIAAQNKANSLNVNALGFENDIKNKIISNVNSHIDNTFQGADFTDQNTLNQFNSFIDQVSKSSELAAIQQHATALSKMEKDRQNAAAKGKTWLNPGLDDAYEYYQKGQFDPNVRFVDQGFEMPDLVKETDALTKSCPSYEEYKTYSPDSRYFVKAKENSMNCLATTFYKSISDPNTPLGKYYNYEFNRTYGKNAEDISNEFMQGKSDKLKSIIGYLPKEQQKDASDEIFKLEQRAKTNDPKVKAEVASYFKKNWFMGQAYEHANLKHEFSESDLKVNDFQKIAAEKQAELKNKKEEIEYQAWVDSGKPVDAEGNPVIYAKETRDNVTPSTYTIKDKAGKTTTVNMHPDLATYYEVVAAAKSGKPSDLFRWNGPSASEGGKGRVDLGRYHWLSGLEKGSVQGEWVQVKDAGFIKSIMDKVSTTVTGGGTSTTTTANLAYYNGMPAVFVNGAGKVIYGVKVGDGKPGTGFAGEDMSFIEVPDAKDYISNLRRNSKENDKKLIDASIPYGNIFEKGTVQQGTSSQSQVNLPKLQSGYIYVQRLNEDPYALRIDSLSSFLKKYPDTKVITTTK